MDIYDNLTVVEKRIKLLRDLKGLSQYELAHDLGVSQSAVNSWERGYNNIPVNQLVRLSYYYKVPIDYIFGLISKFDRNDYQFKNELDLKYMGNNLRIIRKLECLTQTEFAEKIKTKFSNISYYESGKRTISSPDLKDICNTFGFSADWVCGNTKTCIRREKKIKIKEEEIREYIEL